MGRRSWVRLVSYPPDMPRWKRWWYRFKPPPAPPFRPVPRQPWMGPPDDELGVAVPMRHTVTSDAQAVVVLTDCVAFTTGFNLGVGIRKKHEPEPMRFPAVRGFSPPRAEPDEMTIEVSIQFSDGRETARSGHGLSDEVSAWYRAWAEGQDPPVPASPLIGMGGGGGGGKHWDMRYWVWPLPPDGPMSISCRWPAGGVPDGAVEVDGSAIRRAGLSSEKLWSDV
jgi:hypothetical protein